MSHASITADVASEMAFIRAWIEENRAALEAHDEQVRAEWLEWFERDHDASELDPTDPGVIDALAVDSVGWEFWSSVRIG